MRGPARWADPVRPHPPSRFAVGCGAGVPPTVGNCRRDARTSIDEVRVTPMPNAREIIDALRLEPHPIEGGFFRETYRSDAAIPAAALPGGYRSGTDRSIGTAIYY